MDREEVFVLADNQDITRGGLHYYISKTFSTARIIDVKDKKELVDTLVAYGEAVVILDYTLFDLNGIEELLILKNRFTAVRWILFSDELSNDMVRRASVESEISILLKENQSEEICSALKCALGNDRFLCHRITNMLLAGINKPDAGTVLTAAETEVLRLIAHGKSVKEIALQRNSSIHTIITHKKNIFRKLEVNNVYEATKYALRAGLIEMMEYYI